MGRRARKRNGGGMRKRCRGGGEGTGREGVKGKIRELDQLSWAS